MSTKRLLTVIVLWVVFVFSSLSTAAAQDNRPPLPPIIEPPIWRMDGLEIEYQRINVTIENQVATTHIEQLFVNKNDWMLEGTYLFPLPQGAAVSQLTMWVNGQSIEAKILEKEEARDIYDAIVRQLRDPALLEYVDSNAIQANIFPIPPYDERLIEITYSQVLPAENGLVHYVFPQSTSLYSNTPLENQSIGVAVKSNESIHAIYSPTHPVAISRNGEYEAVVGYEDEDVAPKEDFELYYTLSPEEIGLNLLSYRQAGEDGFFMLLVAPEIAAQEVIAKDVLLVLDVSGSMEGQKLHQAQEAATYIIDHLNAEDRFNIIAFSTGVRNYLPEPVTADDAGPFKNFINGLEAVGGTNIGAALLEAALQTDPERPTTIIFVTDGLATEGILETGLILDAVAEAMPRNARLFTFGVGNDVDPDLLDSLAQNHRGTTTYVRPGQAIDEEVSSFYNKVSSPVLSNITLDYEDVIVDRIYPQTLPDLFAGTQLVITGRYRDGGPAVITLSGDINGRSQTITYADQTFRTAGGDDFIPRLWATRAIGHLLREIRLHGENDEWVQSIVNLSIRYGIITPYTSYLIEEEDIFSQTGRNFIAEQELRQADDIAEMPAAPASVDEAAVQAEMAEALTALEVPEPSASAANSSEPLREAVQLVGNKTFVLREGIWMDTAYETDQHEVREIGFATAAYFDLLSDIPLLGPYLALDQQVLVVHEGQAYQIVLVDQETSYPPQQDSLEPTASSSNESKQVTTSETAAEEPVEENVPLPAASTCNGLFAFPGLVGLGIIAARYRRRRL